MTESRKQTLTLFSTEKAGWRGGGSVFTVLRGARKWNQRTPGTQMEDLEKIVRGVLPKGSELSELAGKRPVPGTA